MTSRIGAVSLLFTRRRLAIGLYRLRSDLRVLQREMIKARYAQVVALRF
jgi:hypothetical protein